MKGFQFKLQTVLDYRAKEVDQQQQQVAVEEKKRLEIFELIKQREREIKEAFILQQETMAEGSFQPMQSQVFFAFIQRLKNEHAQLHLALSQQAQIVNQAREVLKQAVIKKKSLELLKEKETKRFVKKIEKLEELNLAEITLARMVHRQ